MGPQPSLNSTLTKSREFMNVNRSHLKRSHSQCLPQQNLPMSSSRISILPPQRPEKLKAMKFPVSKITIGSWTRVANYSHSIQAKFYFAKKKLIWEFFDGEEPEADKARLKRKIEINWADISSLNPCIHYSPDGTGILEVELKNPPTYFLETNQRPKKHTQWTQWDDFTQHQSSICRIHTLHFSPGDLETMLEKVMSSVRFWSELVKVPFPVHQSIYFDIVNGNNNSSLYGHNPRLSFEPSNDLLHHHCQGVLHFNVGEENFNMSNNGRQINSTNEFLGTQAIPPQLMFQQTLSNIPSIYPYDLLDEEDEFLGTQAIPPSLHGVNEHYNMGRHLTGSPAYTPLMCQQMHLNDIPSMYPDDLLDEEDERKRRLLVGSLLLS